MNRFESGIRIIALEELEEVLRMCPRNADGSISVEILLLMVEKRVLLTLREAK